VREGVYPASPRVAGVETPSLTVGLLLGALRAVGLPP
jgi:hypothetical protein